MPISCAHVLSIERMCANCIERLSEKYEAAKRQEEGLDNRIRLLDAEASQNLEDLCKEVALREQAEAALRISEQNLGARRQAHDQETELRRKAEAALAPRVGRARCRSHYGGVRCEKQAGHDRRHEGIAYPYLWRWSRRKRKPRQEPHG